jgi:hypothetical protein
MPGCTNPGKELYCDNVQFFYTSDVSLNEAIKLANYLINSGFAGGDSKITVQIAKENGTFEFRMPVKKGCEQDIEYSHSFKRLAKEISDSVFNGKQVDVHACDETLRTLRVFPMARN